MLLQPDGNDGLSLCASHVVRVAVADSLWHENGEWGANDDGPLEAALGIQRIGWSCGGRGRRVFEDDRD